MHYLLDDMGDAYHISQIRDYQTGLNPYEDFLKDEPKDIVAVKENVQEETTEETAEETQDGQDEVKYSTVEEDETHEKTDEEWREEALAASKEKLDKDQARWAKQVDTFLQKPAEAVEESEKPLFIMDSPVLFDLFGVERLPVYIEEMTLHKIIHGAHVGQGLTEALKRLPFELARPAAVVLNRKGGKRGRNFSVEKEVLIFTSYHVNNEPVNIAFKFNRAGERYKAEAMTKSAWKKAVRRKRKNANKNRNRIPEYYGSRVKSLFARQNVSRFTEPIADNELLYWDTKKGASLFAAANLSPQSYNTTRSFTNNSIAKDESSVNATQENEDSSLERMKQVADERLSNGEKNVTGKRIYTPQDLLPIQVFLDTLEKILKGRHQDEGLLEVVKNLPTAIARPLAVVKNTIKVSSKTKGGRKETRTIVQKTSNGVLVFTSYHVNTIPVNVAFQLEKVGNKYRLAYLNLEIDAPHITNTVFVRRNPQRLGKAIKQNGLLYWDTERGNELITDRWKYDKNGNTKGEVPFTDEHKLVRGRNEYRPFSKDTIAKLLSIVKGRVAHGLLTQKQLENFITRAYRNRNEVRYSEATGESETHKYSESEVQEAFKGQNVTRTDNGYEITFNNGNKLVITETGEMRCPDGRRIRGSYRKGEITLTDMANPFTLGHEKPHFAKDCLYTAKEWAFIEKETRKRLAQEGEMRRPDGTYQAEIMPEEEWRKQVEWERKLPKNRKKQNDSQAIEYSGNRSKTFFTGQEGERLAEGIDKGERLFWDAKKGAALYGGAVNVYPLTDKENSFVESIIANGRPYVKH